MRGPPTRSPTLSPSPAATLTCGRAAPAAGSASPPASPACDARTPCRSPRPATHPAGPLSAVGDPDLSVRRTSARASSVDVDLEHDRRLERLTAAHLDPMVSWPQRHEDPCADTQAPVNVRVPRDLTRGGG